MLIDGNDERGIDVGIMTRSGWEISRIRSHVDDQDAQGLIFSRDCIEYTLTNGQTSFIALVNHLKSKGYGNQADNNAKRLRQATRVAAIYQQLRAEGEDKIAVLGDFNEFPEAPPLQPLLAGTDLKDVSGHQSFSGDPHGRARSGTARRRRSSTTSSSRRNSSRRSRAAPSFAQAPGEERTAPSGRTTRRSSARSTKLQTTRRSMRT